MKTRIAAYLIAAGALLVGTYETPAHDAPAGWTYPLACCSGVDCREIPDDWVVEGPDGYRLIVTNELVPMWSTKIRHSPDGRFHWCTVGGADHTPTLCLFVPPRSF